MKDKARKIIYTLAFGTFSFATIFVFTPKVTHAAFFDIGLKTIIFIVRVMLNIVQFLLAYLVKLATHIVDLVMKLNQTLLIDAQREGSFIYTGWTVFRDLANLGFVLGIIIIAISTILRYKGYTYKQLLAKLIIAALIVNFSLVIAGSIIKVSDVFSNFFLKNIETVSQGGAAGASVGSRLLQTFEVDRLSNMYSSATSTEQTSINNSDELTKETIEIVSIFSGILVMTLVMLVMLGFAIQLLLRYFYLSFLLLLSPMSWILWVFPYTAKYTRDWWTKFIHWVLYAPMVLFFLWLSISFSESGAQIYRDYADQAATGANGQVSKIGDKSLRDLMGPIMSIAILIGGIMIAQKLGYGGTQIAMNAAKGTKKWATTIAMNAAKGTKKWATTKSRRAASRVKSSALKSGLGQKFQAKVSAIPLVGGAAARQLKRGEVAATKEAGEHAREFQKSLDGLSSADKIKLLATTRGEKRYALLRELSRDKNAMSNPELRSQLTANDLLLLEQTGETLGETGAINDFMESMDAKQLASYYSSLRAGSATSDRAAMIIASKGAISSASGLNYQKLLEIRSRLISQGKVKEAGDLLADIGLNGDSVDIMQALVTARASGGTTTAKVKGVDQVWTQAQLESMLAEEITDIRSRQSSEDYRNAMKNTGSAIVNGEFLGVDPETAGIIHQATIDFAADDPSKGVREMVPTLSATEKNKFNDEVIAKKLQWLEQSNVNKNKDIQARMVAEGFSLIDLADDAKLKESAKLRKLKDEKDRVDKLQTEHNQFQALHRDARASGDYRALARAMASSSTSSVREIQELGRSIK